MSDSQTKTLAYVAKSGEALHIAEQFALAVDQEKKAAAQLAAPLPDRLLAEHALIRSNEKQAALDQLNDHAGALKMVGNLLTAMGNMKAAYEQKLAVNPGQPVDDHSGRRKQASDAESAGNPNYVGRRTGAGEKSAADRAFIEKLGLGSLLSQS
ncbi:MAG TPA: hypothetical protein VM487_24210 [Phycisphaerae bacterium]|nr:hypothetical protein [Phycisphaerae bacterium]